MIGPVFLHLSSVHPFTHLSTHPSVHLLKTVYPSGINSISTGDEGAVVSYFTNNGKKYMAFVNKSCTGGLDVKIEFKTEAARVAKDGAESPVEDSYRIPAGDIIIFTWK